MLTRQQVEALELFCNRDKIHMILIRYAPLRFGRDASSLLYHRPPLHLKVEELDLVHWASCVHFGFWYGSSAMLDVCLTTLQELWSS